MSIKECEMPKGIGITEFIRELKKSKYGKSLLFVKLIKLIELFNSSNFKYKINVIYFTPSYNGNNEIGLLTYKSKNEGLPHYSVREFYGETFARRLKTANFKCVWYNLTPHINKYVYHLKTSCDYESIGINKICSEETIRNLSEDVKLMHKILRVILDIQNIDINSFYVYD